MAMPMTPARAGLSIFAACFLVAGAATLHAKERVEVDSAPPALTDEAPMQLAAPAPRYNVSRLMRLAADEGCTDTLPYACNGANMCCNTPSSYYCQNYQGPVESMRGRSGCVPSSASDEAVKDYSQSCSVFTAC
jgi:hypothetical protein